MGAGSDTCAISSRIRSFLRFARLQRLPTDRTVSNTLKETTGAVREELSDLLREVAYDTVREAGLSRLTMELDGTVLRAGCS